MAELAGVPAPWEISIPPETVDRAIRIGRYLIPHAKAGFAEMGADVLVEQAKVILRWIEHKSLDSFTRRDLHQAVRGKFRRAAELDRPLALLIAQGFVRPSLEAPNGGPGRPTGPILDVNPLWAPLAQRTQKASNFEDFEYFEATTQPGQEE